MSGAAGWTLRDLASIVGGRWIDPAPEAPFGGVGIDTRDALRDRVFVAIRGERFDGHDFLAPALGAGAIAAIVERPMDSAPSAPPRLQVHSTREALAAMARAWRAGFQGGMAAVTGSCGKTTTRRLLASILERIGPTIQSPKSFNNELGVPLTLLSATPATRFVVAEIGMNHAGEIRPLAELVRPRVAVITGVGRVHLEALGSVEAIAREKATIVHGVDAGGCVVAPAESAVAMSAVMDAIERAGPRSDGRAVRVVTFGTVAGDARLVSRRAIAGGSQVELAGPWGTLRATLRLPGEHNAMNALVAAISAHEFGAGAEAIAQGLSAVEAADMRFVRRELDSLVVVNDAYNANPESMRASIRTFAESETSAARRVVVIGDMLELGPATEALHGELGEWLAEAFDGGPPDLAVFIGPASAIAAQSYARACPAADRLVLPDAEAPSAEALCDSLRAGDAILLKASRGMALERLVAALAASGVGAGAGGSR